MTAWRAGSRTDLTVELLRKLSRERGRRAADPLPVARAARATESSRGGIPTAITEYSLRVVAATSPDEYILVIYIRKAAEAFHEYRILQGRTGRIL